VDVESWFVLEFLENRGEYINETRARVFGEEVAAA
jgi:hypothetical protein